MIRRLVPLIRLASEYTAAHLTARFLAAISGLLLVRILPVNEYGFYTLVLAAFTFICTFSDLGATETLSFFRWRARSKNRPWFHYYHSVIQFRKSIFIVGSLVSMTYVLVTGYKLSIKWVTLLPSILLMGLGAWFAIQAGINTYVLKLEQQFRSAYVIELGNEVTKLIGAVLMWFAGLTTAIAGIGSVAMGSLVAAILASILLEQSLDKSAETSKRKVKKYTRVLLSQLLPILPGAIHFALQGPFIAWLAAYYGTISNVAEVGALGRVAILIGLISGFAASVVIPRLTLIKDDQTFIERYLLWWGIMFLFGMAIMAAIGIYPKLFLLLLGEHYLNLNEELTISAAAAIIGSWLGFSFNVNRMRGWIRYQKWSVPLIILGQVIMFFSMSFSSTRDVLMFGFGSLLISFLFQLWLNIMGINGLRKNRGT